MNSMLFVNVHDKDTCRNDTCRKLYIKPYYVRKPSMDKLIQLLNTDNTIEMQKLAIVIKRVFIIYKDVIFD